MPYSRILLSAASIIALLGTHVPTSLAVTFPDVPGSSKYSSAFAYLHEHNIVHGFEDGTGRPDAYLNRVEALKTVLHARHIYAEKIMWFKVNKPTVPLFPDTDQTAWYSPYIEVGFLDGVITGHGDGYFRPGGLLTVEEALAILRRAYQRTGEQVAYSSTERLPNAQHQWFSDAVSEANQRNLIMRGSKLQLGKPITRGQFFDILYRLHSVEAVGKYTYDGPEPEVPHTAIASSGGGNRPAISITPLPFNLDDPYSTGQGPTTLSAGAFQETLAANHEFGSTKQFAISIPSLGINDVTIVHPNDPFSHAGILDPLKEGLGHLFAYPGNPGKVMIYGHSSSYPWDLSEYTKVFRTVNKMNTGERIYITYDGKVHEYEVNRKQVIDAADTTPFNDDGTNELILYTCWPPDSIKQRYLVHAVPVETLASR